jgi:Flp pilus assembly protein TadG
MRTMRRRDDRGATAVEFAFVAVPFIFLVIGMIQYGWYFYVSQTAGGAASNVVRELQVGDCWGSGQALARAKNQAPMVTSVDKDPEQTTPPAAGTQLTVTVRANARIIGLVPLPAGGVIEKVVHARAEDQEVGTCS